MSWKVGMARVASLQPVMAAVPRAGREIHVWWLLYVAFVVYGSLVPLDYRPMPWDLAWQEFGRIHLLDVGAAGRADWVANGVLYFPVGFLTASLLSGHGRAARLAVVATMAFVAALALGVEFAQLFFPPRTVSLNDLMAEFIGGGAGAALAVVAADRLRRLLAAWVGGVERFAPRLLKVYALAYCAFSFFPFDFLMSTGELGEKLASESWGWLWAGSGGRGGSAAGVAKLAAEALAAAPLGWLFASRGWTRGRVLAGGAVLGATIEIGQFFLVSGVAQGFSVVTRAAGVLAGAVAWEQRRRLDPLVLAGVMRRFGVGLVVLYVLALLAVTGWFELPWRGWSEASLVLAGVRFLPFYYHYYTTEQAALLSLTSVCLLYAPLGVLAWAYFLGPGLAGCLAALMAGAVEGSKLFLAGQHPDPTNLLLALAAGWLGCRLGQGAEGLAQRAVPQGLGRMAENVPDPAPSAPLRQKGREAASPGTARASTGGAEHAWCRPGALGLAGLAAAGGLAAWGVLSFPLHPALLGLAMAGYGVALWYRPHWLWVAVPAALALLDLAPWSGRFFFDEFDLLLLVSVAVGYARLGPVPAGRRDGAWRPVVGLVVLAYGIATLRGLLPWQGLDANAFSHYYSPFNALRIAKGAGWAFLLVVLARRFAAAGMDVGRHFGQGLVLGLAGTVATVIWERWTFPGLFNFADVYRVTGPFSQMHTGGADLDCYLTAAAPFLVWGLFERRGWLERSLGVLLLAASTYAVMVSFSRAAYAGFGLAVAVAALFAWRHAGRGRPVAWIKSGLAAVALGALVLAVAAPVFLGGFAQARLSRAGEDLALRTAHWRDALAMRDGGLATEIFGMGLGRFPATHYWRSQETRAASYQIGREGDNPYLRLGTGSPLYVEQFVAVQPGRDYALNLRARSSGGGARLSVSLCEKWLLTSARCVFGGLEVPGGEWRELTVRLPLGDVGNEPWYCRRPVKFSLYNAGRDGVVEVDDVRLAGRDGQQLLGNGNFAQGMDQWFFTADVDLPWYIWSLPVAALFAAGWLGCVAGSLFAGLAVIRGLKEIFRGNLIAACWLASVCGLAVIAAVADFSDSPRILLLLFLAFSFLVV